MAASAPGFPAAIFTAVPPERRFSAFSCGVDAKARLL
jgi:hypothetical protein